MTSRLSRFDAAILAVSLSAVVLVGCSSTTAGNSAGSTSLPATIASSPTTAAVAGGCGGGAQAGQGGILQLFCGGTGDAKITLGPASKELKGGTCVEQAGQFAINFGAVAGPDYPAGQAKPDYLGALVDNSTGALNAFTVSIDGTSSGVITNRTATVSADKKSATLNGKRQSDGAAVTAKLTC